MNLDFKHLQKMDIFYFQASYLYFYIPYYNKILIGNIIHFNIIAINNNSCIHNLWKTDYYPFTNLWIYICFMIMDVYHLIKILTELSNINSKIKIITRISVAEVLMSKLINTKVG